MERLLTAFACITVIFVGFAVVFLTAAKSGEPDGTPCRAQVVEWERDGGRCTFVPVDTVLFGRLENGICVTSEVGK